MSISAPEPVHTAIYQFLLESLPKVFLGKEIDKLTGGFLRWRTIQNQRSAGLIPAECFERISPRKIAVIRAPFLAWWKSYSQQ